MRVMTDKQEKPQNVFNFDYTNEAQTRPPQDYYDNIKNKYADERDLRLGYRPPGTDGYTSDLTGDLAKYAVDPYGDEVVEREVIDDSVEVLFIGGGFSALLTSARLREKGVESIRIVERGADVGGTWYWNRYPGVACDVVAYDYLPLLDETGYVPSRHYAGGEEIFQYCKQIAERFNLYELAVFGTTVTSTVWDETTEMWHVGTDRGDTIRAQFVICANGTLSKPKLAKIDGIERFAGHSFHTSRWDYEYTGPELEGLRDKRVGIIGTGASAVQAIPQLGKAAKELIVEWAATLEPGWQSERRTRAIEGPQISDAVKARRAALSREEKIRRQENANIDAMMRIHNRIDEVIEDPATAESLKPWYMLMCKRPCFHNEYLPTFNLPTVTLVDTKGEGITEISEAGPVFDGTQYEVDVLIYATGFEVQQTGIYNRIEGEGGQELNEKYVDGIRTLVGIHSQGYPNLFIMGGYQAFFAFNLTDVLNSQGEHIAECIDFVRHNGIHSLDCDTDAEEWWVQEVIAHRGKTSRNQDCTPGYYNFEGAENRRQDGNYNGTMKQYLGHMSHIRDNMADHFVFTQR
jgi:cation diffusion facilitator CzcD-associated flavoprotein CzcO